MPRPRPTAGPLIAALPGIVLFLGVYVGAYFIVSEFVTFPLIGRCRQFDNRAVVIVYWPMVKMESWVRRTDVNIVIGND